MIVTLVLILAVLLTATTVSCVYLFLKANRTSTPPTPTVPTTRTQTSEDLTLTMLKTVKEMSENQAKEMKELVITLVQGREQQSQSGEMGTPQTQNEWLTNYDDDSIPLSPGIEAILGREEDEDMDLLRASLRERSGLQERLKELEAEMSSRQLSDYDDPSPNN